METNSGSAILAMVLASAPERATFTSLITRKQGTVRGGRVYGDDMVHTVVLTGFRYDRLVERSQEKLVEMRSQAADIAKALASKDAYQNGKLVQVTEADVIQAMDELELSFKNSLDPTMPSTSTTDHVYEPLVVDGEVVRGARVYVCAKGKAPKCHCRDCTGDEKAPKAGTIYLQGLAIGSKVLEPAPNGPAPASRSNPVVVAKNYLRYKLPVGRYVSYRLEGDFVLKVGGTAAVKVDDQGIHLDRDLVALVATAV